MVGLEPESADEVFDEISSDESSCGLDEIDDSDSYILAKTFFDMGEYLRCAFVLEHAGRLSRTGVFLWGYSLYLVSSAPTHRTSNTYILSSFSLSPHVHCLFLCLFFRRGRSGAKKNS